MKEKKYINFTSIGLSLIFLFNPNINVIDFLPDFIGYILLCIALVNLADINETVAESMSIFKKMIFIDAAKVIALMWIFGISVTTEKNSSLMLWSFAFGVLELIFVIPAFNKLFKGIGELGFFHSNTSVHAQKGKGKKNYTDSIRVFTVVFICIKSVMSFLPELADLTSTEYYENHGMTNLYNHIGIMRFLAFIPVLVLGVVWIFKCVAYFKRISKDVTFVDSLQKVYCQKVLPKQGTFVKRNVRISLLLLLLALGFSFDIRFEYVNVLPDFISAALFISFFSVVVKKTKINKHLSLAVCSGYLLTAIVSSVTEFMFFNKYSYTAIYRDEQAYSFFIVMAVCACANIAMFALTSRMALIACNAVVTEHTGVITVTGTNTKMSETIHRDLRRSLIYCAAATAIYIVTDVCYILMAKDYGFMLLINIIGVLLLIAAYCKAYFDILEAVESKYILE